MNKLALTTIIVGAALAISAKPAYAAEIEGQDSEVGIRFDTNGPVQPGPGPYKDNLSMAWTPSKFNFGKQEAVAKIATYNNMTPGEQYIVVNDDREGAPEDEGGKTKAETKTKTSAWKVTAKMSKLVSKDNSTTELPAKLMFSLDKAQAYDIGDVDPDTNDYLPNVIEGNLSPLPDPNNIEVGTDISLEAGNTTGTKIIAKTKEDTMQGGFATKLSKVKLVVTSSEKAAGKAFKGSVTWSLDNTY